MSSRPSSKNYKKRKTGTPDPTQRKLDRFLATQVKDDPMQLDTPPSVQSNLGTFRQQSLLPTIVIHNLNTSRPKELPSDYFETSWATQKMFIAAVFTNNRSSHLNFMTISKLSENLCRFGKAEAVYRALIVEFENHVKHIQAELLSIPLNQQLLTRLNASWNMFCSQLLIIRNVFMELDRTYILPNTQYASIVQLGKRIFSDIILDVAEFRNVVIAEVLVTIQQERDGQSIDTGLVKQVLHMLLELAFYTSDFEPKFIASTNQYYKAESDRLIQTLTPPDYILHVVKRCEEESEKIHRYLDTHTTQPLTAAVTHQLMYSKTEIVIQKGFNIMMDQQQYEPLKMFYQLVLNHIRSLNLLRDAFGHYIKTQGVALITNSPADPSMIIQLLKFKKKMDKALKSCFEDDALFMNASKESFEYFINTRGNKPAELLAKFIDAKLKLYTKKQRTTGAEADLHSLDSALVLFRFIQGKDAFEVYYKRFLAKRLLLDRSSSNDLENHVLEGLKHECGQDFTKNLESMFHDIQVSADLDVAFEKDSKKKKQLMPVHVKVIAQGTWPTYPVSDIRLSSEMLATQKAYEQFYTTKFKGRKLIWQNALSSCTLFAHYPKGMKEITVSLSQAVILCLFNKATKKSFSVTEIQGLTHLSRKDVLGLLASVSTGNYKLIVNDTGDKYRYNEAFESEAVKLRVPPASIEQTTEETKDVEQKVHINRQHQLEAAIVRIMKAKKNMSHTALMSQLFNELKYPLEADTIKMRIESLIERDYLMRDPNDNASYVYQA